MLRKNLFARLELTQPGCLLEAGCGTGAVLGSLRARSLHGLDINPRHLRIAAEKAPLAQLVCASVLHMPYPPAFFDAACCHFLLLWLKNPVAALRELARVTRPGGWVLALAEPDYGGRIDHPAPLAELSHLQGESLRLQGADPNAGRKLAGWFGEAGLNDVHSGLLGGEWSQSFDEDSWRMEWAVLENDLAGQVAGDHLANLRRLDAAAWRKGERILFVPTFYAWGKVPNS